MILIEALTEHRALPRLGEAKFQYLFVEQDPERHRLLVENIAALDIPQPIQIDIRFDRFELVLDELNRQARVGIGQPPTFMFVDPFGYSESGLSITGNLLQFPRCEVLYFLPLTQISRFIGTDGPAEAITALFGSEEWREAIPLPLERRNECLGDLFEKQLVAQPGIKYARSLRVHTEDGNDYRLVFGLKHLKGLQAAKDAMWKVDPLAGTEYRATGVLGQGTLFGTHAIFDAEDLLNALRSQYGQDWFTIDQAEEFTLAQTRYRYGHLRRDTLEPAIKQGRLDCERASERGLRPGSRLRFRE